VGFMDKAKDAISGNKDKMSGAVDDHADKIDSGIDTGGDFANDKTGGTLSDQIDGGGDKVRDGLDGLDGKDDDLKNSTVQNQG